MPRSIDPVGGMSRRKRYGTAGAKYMIESNLIVAVNTLAYHGYQLRTALQEIAELGVTYVEPALISSYYPEMDDQYFSVSRAREFRKQIAHHGLQVLAVGAHMNLGWEGVADSFQRRMGFACELGARFIHTNSTTKSKRQVFLRNLDRLLPLADSYDLVITLENPGDTCDSLMGTGKEGGDLIESVGSPRLRLNYDFSNTFSYSLGKIKPEKDFRCTLPYAAHFHLKDMMENNGEWIFVAVGEGITNYKSIFRYLLMRGKIPPMSVELPLRFKRGSDYQIKFDPGSPPVPLGKIRRVLRASLDYVHRELTPR